MLPFFKRLLFAGEATDERFYSTVHGAFASGVREAERILASRKKKEKNEKNRIEKKRL